MYYVLFTILAAAILFVDERKAAFEEEPAKRIKFRKYKAHAVAVVNGCGFTC